MELWGGRFERPPDQLARELNASIDVDRRLWSEDILGSIAHARMLGRQGIIPEADAKAIVAGLKLVYAEIERGEFPFRVEFEDIHLNIERRLTELIGPVAGKLHTARSRNDQVALDIRLYARRAICRIVDQLADLQAVLVARADADRDVAMPGYTHLQRAQPILLGHHWLAYFEMFQRDAARLRDAYERVNISPLGAGALAGLPYPIDREWVATELGFAGITRNSLDAVSDRDFLVEIMAAVALAMAHLSRLGEELILWTSTEFGFVTLDDAYATGSSIMPQKKNPDIAELLRGKTGRVYGDLIGLLTVIKGLPLSYNKDLQEDKAAFFDAIDTLTVCLAVAAPMIATLTIHGEKLNALAAANYALATEYADYLARRGLPFRAAHEVAGKLVRVGLATSRALEEIPLAELRRFSDLFGEDVRDISVRSAIDARDVPGGTASRRVAAAIDSSRDLIVENRSWLESAVATLPTLPPEPAGPT